MRADRAGRQGRARRRSARCAHAPSSGDPCLSQASPQAARRQRRRRTQARAFSQEGAHQSSRLRSCVRYRMMSSYLPRGVPARRPSRSASGALGGRVRREEGPRDAREHRHRAVGHGPDEVDAETAVEAPPAGLAQDLGDRLAEPAVGRRCRRRRCGSCYWRLEGRRARGRGGGRRGRGWGGRRWPLELDPLDLQPRADDLRR